jgi:hypothetical protein
MESWGARGTWKAGGDENRERRGRKENIKHRGSKGNMETGRETRRRWKGGGRGQREHGKQGEKGDNGKQGNEKDREGKRRKMRMESRGIKRTFSIYMLDGNLSVF